MSHLLFCDGECKITGRGCDQHPVPKHAQAVRSMSMSEQQSSCAQDSDKCGTVEYRTINNFPTYRVGDDGSVWSFRAGRWKRLSQTPDRHGYLYLDLSRAGHRKRRFYVHVLVALHFVGPKPDGCECLHKNGDHLCNAPWNLRWGTRLENVADAKAHGTWIHGSTCCRSQLTDGDVRLMKMLWGRNRGKSGVQFFMSRWFGVSQPSVSDICRNKTWRHINVDVDTRH